jgi:antitoxin PrlF
MKARELTLSPKGQVTIPKDVRELLNLKPGDLMVHSVIDGEIVITPKNVDFNDLAGMLGKPPKGPSSLEAIDEAILKAAGRNALDIGEDGQEDTAA